MIWELVVAAIGAYFFGSIPAGLIVGKVYRRIDVREYGSGRIGSTNILRTLGPGAALIVLISDTAKGVLPVLAARWLTGDAAVQAAAGVGAVLGHDWPIYVGFRGGRGVATAAGALIGMLPLMALVVVAAGLALLLPFRYVSLMSIGGTLICAGVVVALAVHGDVDLAYAVYGAVASALIVALHRENIERLLKGTEPKLGRGGGRRTGPPGLAGRP